MCYLLRVSLGETLQQAGLLRLRDRVGVLQVKRRVGQLFLRDRLGIEGAAATTTPALIEGLHGHTTLFQLGHLGFQRPLFGQEFAESCHAFRGLFQQVLNETTPLSSDLPASLRGFERIEDVACQGMFPLALLGFEPRGITEPLAFVSRQFLGLLRGIAPLLQFPAELRDLPANMRFGLRVCPLALYIRQAPFVLFELSIGLGAVLPQFSELGHVLSAELRGCYPLSTPFANGCDRSRLRRIGASPQL